MFRHWNAFRLTVARKDGADWHFDNVHCLLLLLVIMVQVCKGVPRTFHWGSDRRPRAGMGFSGRGSSPFPLARRSGERCELLQWGLGRSADRPKVFHYFRHSGWPFLTLILLIVDYHAAIRGKPPWPTPVTHPLAYTHECTLRKTTGTKH